MAAFFPQNGPAQPLAFTLSYQVKKIVDVAYLFAGPYSLNRAGGLGPRVNGFERKKLVLKLFVILSQSRIKLGRVDSISPKHSVFGVLIGQGQVEIEQDRYGVLHGSRKYIERNSISLLLHMGCLQGLLKTLFQHFLDFRERVRNLWSEHLCVSFRLLYVGVLLSERTIIFDNTQKLIE